MSTAVPVLHPDLRVMLYKLVARETVDGNLPASKRFRGAGRAIDLSPFFSDMGSIHTTKAAGAPAGGFTLVFTDKPHGSGGTLESLYGLMEPMDGIEIRLSHTHRLPGRQPPIVMRGFITRITRSQQVDGQGNPIRIVTVEGQDYGKIWQMLQILWRPLYALGEVWLSTFPLFERFGLAITANKKAADFVKEVVENVINPHLAQMLPEDWPMPRSLVVDATVVLGLTSATGPQNQEGPIYGLLANFTDANNGFNQLYIEDREDEVAVVFRPSPAIDLDGKPIQPPNGDAEARPKRVSIPGTDIVSLELSRTDQDVANYFWVEDPRFELVREFPLQFAAAASAQRATVFMESYPNNDPKIYGIRPIVTATQMGDSRTFQGGQDATGQVRREAEEVRWLDDRRSVLGRTNRDNVLLESGVARIAGNENVRAGGYVEIGSGSMAAPYYVSAVAHDYVPFKGFFTTLTLERGQGFARRIQLGAGTAPWLIELGAGPRPATRDPTAPADVGQLDSGAVAQGKRAEALEKPAASTSTRKA